MSCTATAEQNPGSRSAASTERIGAALSPVYLYHSRWRGRGVLRTRHRWGGELRGSDRTVRYLGIGTQYRE